MIRRISAVLLLAAALAACGRGESPRPDAIPADRVLSAFPSGGRGQQVDFAAVPYFASHCARCHGPEGSFYGGQFGKDLSDADLRGWVAKMAAGPGTGPLQPLPLAVETAYQRSIQEKTPFVHVMSMTRTGDTWTLRGEVSPNSILEIRAGGQTLRPPVTDTLWTAEVPAADAEIIAHRGGAATRLKLADGTWSHGTR